MHVQLNSSWILCAHIIRFPILGIEYTAIWDLEEWKYFDVWSTDYGRILSFGGKLSAWKNLTKAGMESANQIHIQPLASYIGEGKC